MSLARGVQQAARKLMLAGVLFAAGCAAPGPGGSRTAGDAVTPRKRNDPYAAMRHAQIVSQTRRENREAQLVFLGDSISDFWRFQGRKMWQRFQDAGYHPANLGIAGDRTEHVLWRIENGEIDGVSPKVVVVLIGTNNLGQCPDEKPEWAAAGVREIVATLRERLPRSRILLLGVFPRSTAESDTRQRVRDFNRLIARLNHPGQTRFLNLERRFLDQSGQIRGDAMWFDKLHLTARGYEIWYEAMEPTLGSMMREKR